MPEIARKLPAEPGAVDRALKRNIIDWFFSVMCIAWSALASHDESEQPGISTCMLALQVMSINSRMRMDGWM